MKSAHSTRNRYSSQWTLTKCQASTPARTLTSDWRTVGSQHGITVTESDSYSASLSQDTGTPAVPGRKGRRQPRGLPGPLLSRDLPVLGYPGSLAVTPIHESSAEVEFTVSQWGRGTMTSTARATCYGRKAAALKSGLQFLVKITNGIANWADAGLVLSVSCRWWRRRRPLPCAPGSARRC